MFVIILQKNKPKPISAASGIPVHTQESQQFYPGDEVVGKYNFHGSASQDLPFKRGDTLVIITPSKSPNWYMAKRYDGLEGMIPYNYVINPAKELARKKAEELARKQAEELARKTVRIQYMPYVTYILQMANIVVTLCTILQ